MSSQVLNADKPISNKTEDFLGRHDFACAVSNAIMDYHENNQESLTIGLYGKWGSGKTSIVNLITDEINSDDIIIFKFEPWIYSDTEQLISYFFRDFAKAVKHKDYAQEALKLGEELETYATFFEPIGMIPEPNVALISRAASKIFGGVGKSAKKWGKLKTRSLSGTKESIEKHLLKINKKILIIVDDIDRLNNTEIRQIFQMIKMLGNFSNTIYLTSMDREVVIDALSEVQKGDGNEYLEKIINVPFSVPMPSIEKIQQYLFSELDKIIGEKSDFDQEYFSYIFRHGYSEFFENIRDINRYINILKFNYSIVGKEVDIVDLFVMTALQVFEPKIYDYLKYNKDIVLSLKYYSEEKDKAKDIDLLKQVTGTLLSRLSENDYFNLMGAIFPVLDRYAHDDKDKCTKLARVCSPDFYDLYFKMSLDEDLIGKVEMSKYIKHISDEGLFKTDIDTLIESDKIGKFLDRLEAHVKREKFNKIQTQNLCNIFIEIGDKMQEKWSGELFYYPPAEQMRSTIIEAIKSLDIHSRFEVLNNAIKRSNTSIELSSGILYSLMEEHGEYEKYALRVEDRLLSETDLKLLKNSVLKNIETRISQDTFHKSQKFIILLRLLKKLSQSDFDTYTASMMYSDDKLIAFLKGFVNTSYSSASSGPSFKYDSYHYIQDFIDPDNIAVQTNKLKENMASISLDNKEEFAIDEFLKCHNEDRGNSENTI